MKILESFIVSVSFSDKNHGVLIVGKQNNGKVDVINAFEGEEAMELFKKLIIKSSKNGGN